VCGVADVSSPGESSKERSQPPYNMLMAPAINFENLRIFKKAQFPFPPRTLKLVQPPIPYDVPPIRWKPQRVLCL
jgi:hypothetical protein